MEELKIRILEAASGLYMKFGIKSVTMDDISRHLAMSKKTLYSVFQDKRSLVAESIFYFRQKNFKLYEEVFSHSENAIEEMLKVNYAISHHLTHQTPWMDFDLKKYYPEIYQKLDEENKQLMRQEVEKNLTRGKEEGLFRENLDEKIIADLLVARVAGLKQKVHEKTIVKYDRYYNDQVFLYHLHGIASPKGLEYAEKNYDRLMQTFKEALDNVIPI